MGYNDFISKESRNNSANINMPDFNKSPVLNSPYKEPLYHWQLSENGNMTNKCLPGRRISRHFIPVPNPDNLRQQELLQKEAEETTKVNVIRKYLKEWQEKPIKDRAHITGTTKKLLAHWHNNKENRLFFCQLEAAETFIWLNEVAPKSKIGRDLLEHIRASNNEANPGLFRLATKMATGAGKTTVMAMLIAYHTVNKVRKPESTLYSSHFLIITPGITIKDRLRVLLPQDPENYYEKRTIVPLEMLDEVRKATVIITNYHAFKRRETRKLSEQQRRILVGHTKEKISTKESDGKMLLRICPELLRGAKNAVVINDEAHHCYIHKTSADKKADEGDVTMEGDITTEEKEDVKRNDEAARLWINGIKILGRKIKIQSVYDLSATPFFLRGSGYREGTLFPWVASDFSLIEAIESGIVKLPRVPVKDGTTEEMPVYRNLYQHIREHLPQQGRGGKANMDPQKLPSQLRGALLTLYSHYKETYEAWEKAEVGVPPVFIIVCNNTSTSKLIYDYISGYQPNELWRKGEFSLFDNVANSGDKLRARPRTLLIDSYQLESGETLTDEFKKAAATEIDIFKKELRVRYPDQNADKISDEDLLREVMNTVGRKERLGEQIRCVVSVSMLTEGWDTNNVTHILGVRAFGTQLLCEQVVGRALRRFDYEVKGDGKFSPEYAEVFGVPFSFMSDSKAPPPKPPKPTTRVRHLDERNALEITYPRVRGYRIQPPEKRLVARFTKNSHLTIKPEMAPPVTKQKGIVGKSEFLTLDNLKQRRLNEVEFFLAAYFCSNYYANEGAIAPARFRDMMPIVRRYLSNYVTCLGNTFKQYLLWEKIAEMAAERIYRAMIEEDNETNRLLPLIDPYTPEGSTVYVDFLTRKKRLHETEKSHINLAICDSDWELDFCIYLEDDPGVFCYTRNEGLGFEVPYTHAGKERHYRPDFIVHTDDGAGIGDLLHLVVEIKGFRGGDAQAKADTMERLWVPAVNNSGDWGRWQFLEIMDMQDAREKLAQFTAGGRR